MIVVCMSMTTGEAITKQTQSSDQRHCACQNEELLHSVSSSNTSRYRARRRCLSSLVIFVLQRAEADSASAGTRELIGNLGEGLCVCICPICGCAIGQDGRAPVGCDGWKLSCRCDGVGVDWYLAGSVGRVVSESMAEETMRCCLLEDFVVFSGHACGFWCGLL